MSFAKQIVFSILTCALISPVNASDREATYDITHVYSNVSFNITKFFFNEEGGFRQYSGKIVYDPDHPDRSHVQMIVQAESIDTRNEGRDRALRSDNFFDAGRYPTLSFVSTSVAPRENGILNVAGDLTIHGVTKHITIPVRFLGTKQMQGFGDFIGFDTEFTINRSEFGVNGGSSWSGILGNEVEIHLSIGAFREGNK